MEFLKKHYEKVILGVVLLGLTAGLAFLPFKIANERMQLEEQRNRILTVRPKELEPPDTERTEAVLKRLRAPVLADFSLPHNLFNPVPWQRQADGRLIPIRTGAEIGPARVEITQVSPLYLTMSLEQIGASGTNYLISIKKQAETNPRRASVSRYVAVGEKIDVFTLREVVGPPDKPERLIFEATDTGERVVVTPDQPYQRVDGYTVDYRYEPDNLRRANQRVGSTVRLSGEDYTLVSINLVAPNSYEIVFSARSTGKKTTVRYTGAP